MVGLTSNYVTQGGKSPKIQCTHVRRYVQHKEEKRMSDQANAVPTVGVLNNIQLVKTRSVDPAW